MLSNTIALIIGASYFGIEAYRTSGRVARYVLAGLSSLFLLAGVFLQPLTTAFPKVGAFITGIFDDPSSWFILFVGLFFILRPFWAKRSQTHPPGTTLGDVPPSLAQHLALDKRLSDELHAIAIRVDEHEADLESAKDGEGSLRAAIQAFMKVPISATNEVNERLSFEQSNLVAEIESIKAMIHTYDDRVAQMDGLRAKALEAQFERVYTALAAIAHRERLAEMARTIETGATVLLTPTNEKVTLDEESWGKWQISERAWRDVVERWCELASTYVPVARDSVMTISDEQYRQKGVATASLFPDSEAFIEYKAFCAIWKNWQDAVESVNRTVYLVAFDSAYRPRPRTLGELYEGGREDR